MTNDSSRQEDEKFDKNYILSEHKMGAIHLRLKEQEAEIQTLSQKNRELQTLVDLFIEKRSVDGLNGRNWEAGRHLKAEEAIQQALASQEGNERVES